MGLLPERPLTRAPGTYALVLDVDRARRIEVGRLGEVDVPSGTLVYVGSAFGPGGLAARIERHRRAVKRVRWHVDHLLRVARIEEVWLTTDPVRRECEWARTLLAWPGATVPHRRFGSSDCRCTAHLVALPARPSLAGFRRALSRHSPEHGPVRRVGGPPRASTS